MIDSRIKFEEKAGNCLYFIAPSKLFPDFKFKTEICELSVDICENCGVIIEIKIDDYDWREIQIPQEEIIELLKIALKEDF